MPSAKATKRPKKGDAITFKRPEGVVAGKVLQAKRNGVLRVERADCRRITVYDWEVLSVAEPEPDTNPTNGEEGSFSENYGYEPGDL